MSDLTFFTNEPGATLLDRFKQILVNAKYFDILVGFFRTSGFHLLYESFEPIEKIRILVGMNVDSKTYDIIEQAKASTEFDFEPYKKAQDNLSNTVDNEMAESPDSYETELGVKKFIEYIKSGKIEFRIYPSRNIHAKVYINRYKEGDKDVGRVITGSSNFTESGLIANREFNVELKNGADVKFALNQFERLWEEAVDISQTYIETINSRTWLNDTITPYELYLKFLYEYFKEELSFIEEDKPYLPEGFIDLEYQRDAYANIRRILEAYNGIFLADVVGLGKTYISAILAQILKGSKLVICPPILKEYWEDTFREFGVRNFTVESLGMLDHILRKGKEYDYIFIDEAHRFRNEFTTGYEQIHQTCVGKKIILVTATPLNNKIDDIFSQLKLFQIPKKSNIPGVPDLMNFFNKLKKKIKSYEKDDPEYLNVIKEVNNEIREKILKYIMVRRTRKDILNYFEKDMKQQGLSFPEVANPKKIIYEFDSETEKVFYKTIELLRELSYARYTPLLNLKKELPEYDKQSQRNLGGFMKSVLVKRLESSFYAFKKTIGRFIDSYKQFIDMFKKGTVYISKKVNVYDLLDSDNLEELLRLVQEDKVKKYESTEFKDDFLTKLNNDLNILKDIKTLWDRINKDPKLQKFIQDLTKDRLLKNKRIIVFSESKETGDYLYEHLCKIFSGKVILFSSKGGNHNGKGIGFSDARYIIKQNFDPNSKNKKDDIDILITTDILSEGINLHRSNIVINYDLPWNPTKVLQRVGRINRVTTEHKNIYIYNFFPTSPSDEHLGLENNIKAKIIAFHELLGEDARYLTDEEEPMTHKLFGDTLFRRLNDKKSYIEEEGENIELKYKKIIKDIRDTKSDLFEKIKKLPKKARSSRFITTTNNDSVVTFFRKEMLKKFYQANQNGSEEISFFDAIKYFECEPTEQRLSVTKEYYNLLAENKKEFNLSLSEQVIEKTTIKGRSNEAYIIRRLKSNEIRRYQGFTDDDEEYLKSVLKAFEYGMIPKKTSQKVKKEIEREKNPLKILNILRINIPQQVLDLDYESHSHEKAKKEVILSEYLKRVDK